MGTGVVVGLRVAGRLEASGDLANRIHLRATVLATSAAAANDRFGWFHLQRGRTLLLLGEPDAAAHDYEIAWEYGTGSTADVIASSAAADLALVQAMDGAGAPSTAVGRAPSVPRGIRCPGRLSAGSRGDLGRGIRVALPTRARGVPIGPAGAG